jgi:hypothetical protein
MAKSEIFRVNYYIGPLLAQGGNIWIDDSKVIFSPTSALDRAMGAGDIEIPFQHISDLVFKGDLLRTFNIKTPEKTHKFEGSQAKKVWALLDQSLKATGSRSSAPASIPASSPATTPPLANTAKSVPTQTIPPVSMGCDQCAKPLYPGYSFCPFCGTRIKSVCSSCRRAIVLTWSVCAWCGWKFTPTGSPSK